MYREETYEFIDGVPSGSTYEEYVGRYKLRELSWGEDNSIINIVSERIMTSNPPIIRFNFEKYNVMLFAKSLIEWPLKTPITEETVSKLPKRIADPLFRIVNRLNTITTDEQRDFLPKSEAVSIQTRQAGSS